MVNTSGPDNILSLQTQDALKLIMEPVTHYPNMFEGAAKKLFFWEFGKDKTTLTHVTAPSYIIQAKQACDKWRPRGRAKLKANQIAVMDHEVMIEYCYEDFNKGCLRNMMPAKDESKNNNLDLMDMAITRLIREALQDDFYRLAWFSQEDFRDVIASGRYDVQNNEMTEMMESNNGWWPEIEAYVNDGLIRFLDTNDGTASGNAAKKTTIVEFLRELKGRSTQLLKAWNKAKTIWDRPYFLLESALFDALKQHYQDLNLSEGLSMKMNGETIPGILQFDGHIVMDMSEWESFDLECGAYNNATGYSKIQRALFIAPQMLSGLVNAKNLPGQTVSFNVQRSPDQRDKGMTSVYGNYGYGFGIAHQDLVTAGYNSSYNFN